MPLITKHWVTAAAAVATLVLVPACAGEHPEEELGPEAQAESSPLQGEIRPEGPDLYYITTRPDFRKCLYPLCGGAFVKAVNLRKTKCYGGSFEKDCYVADWDFSALGLPPGTEQKLSIAADNGQVVMRGHYEQLGTYFPVAKLVVDEAWLGVSGDDPDGAFYGVHDSGIVCVTYPCPSFEQTLLNDNQAIATAGVDLSHTSASSQQINDALSDLFGVGLVVTGKNFNVTGPGGTLPALRASEFYRRLP